MAVVISETICINSASRAAVRARKSTVNEQPEDSIESIDDTDGLGAMRGFFSALVIVLSIVASVVLLPMLIGLLSTI